MSSPGVSEPLAEAVSFPPMCDANLDAATLDRLFADLAGCTEVLGVVLKTGARAMVAPRSVGLDEARQAFLSGQARAVQVRYRYDAKEWIDTLLHAPAGVRLVRCQVPDG
jgi:hypothetical protein